MLAHLRGNPDYLHITDSPSALACALKPGVSGTREPRGNGLTDLLKFAQDVGVGRLVIRSGNGIASVAQRRHHRRDAYAATTAHITGTWAWLRIRFP